MEIGGRKKKKKFQDKNSIDWSDWSPTEIVVLCGNVREGNSSQED